MSDWNAARADAADRAIDRAVREIMSAEPRAGFRHRVLARLDETPRPSSSWTWTRAAVAAIGALAIVMAVVFSRPTDRRSPEPQIVERQPAAVPAQPAVPERRPAEPRRQPAAPVASNSASGPRTDRESTRSEPRLVRAASLVPDMSATDVDADRIERESSVMIEPIRIAPLSMTPLVPPPQVTVRPLPALDQIAISPLPPPR